MSAPLFDLRRVRFAYDRNRLVLDGLDFRVEPGDRLALTGPNGAGKTTVFHVMLGLLQPASGEVEAFGRVRSSEADFRAVRARTGLLFQDPDDQLFCPTVEEDVAFGPLNLGASRAEARARVAETLAMLGLCGFEKRISYKLSGGEKRLVSLAAVLAMSPEVLLLDEPGNGLDEVMLERLTRILVDLPQTLVVISHDALFLKGLGVRCLRMQHGRLIV